MKNTLLKSVTILISVFLLLNTSCMAAPQNKQYGVFIGMNRDELSKLFDYEEVIIDAAYFTKEDLSLLHEKNVKVYSYLNIGSLENFRPYYKEYEGITLGEYENWPDERWVDVSKKEWQSLVVEKLAKELSDKGVDGFFLDNAVVYEVYPGDEIFNGLISIISSLKQTYGKKIIVNGGFGFLSRAIDENVKLSEIIDGVNRESVLTKVDFKSDTFKLRPAQQVEFALEDIRLVNSKIESIYIIEYSKSSRTNSKITKYYSGTNYNVYIANSLSLD